MTAPAFGPIIDVPRHGGNGNPLILLPEYSPNEELASILLKRYDKRTAAERREITGKYGYYSRASSAGKAIDNSAPLAKWGQRMVAIGLSQRSDLLLNVSAHASNPEGNKRTLDDLCQKAIEAARASAAANEGTARHKLAELVDAGLPLPIINEAAQRDIDAYRDCLTRYGVTMHKSEQFVVCDELQVAGSFDRTMSVHGKTSTYLGDIKTGNVARNERGQVERDERGVPVLAFVNTMAVQLAVYANSSLYDPLTGQRTPLDVHPTSAIVIHLPQGLGSCELHWLNIKEGWEAAQLAGRAREWQRRRDLTRPFGGAA